MHRITDFLSDVRALARREPVITRFLVGLAVTVAAKYGLNLDGEVILAYLLVGTPVTVAQRRKVSPADSGPWGDPLDGGA